MAKKSLSNASNDRRDHLANERTFLAWIRTSIGIMAFGFVVEKFALFVKQIGYFLASQKAPEEPIVSPSHQALSSVFGICLVAIGALIGVISFIVYKRIERQIDTNDYRHSSLLSTALTVLVVIIGVFLVLYLASTK